MNESDYKKIKVLAELFDRKFNLFGIRFGIDPIVSIIPFFGDVVGLALGLSIFFMTWHVRMSAVDRFRIIFNILIDFVVGFIPYAGVIFDVFYRSNMQNLKILEKYRGQLKTKEKVVEGEVVD